MHWLHKSAFITIFIGITSPILALPNWHRSFDQGMQASAQRGKPMIVDFYTDWCGWCKKLDKDVFQSNEFDQISKNFICIKVDCDQDKKTPQKYKVSGYPTIGILKPNGELIEKVVGYRDKKQLMTLLNQVLKDHPPTKLQEDSHSSENTPPNLQQAKKYYQLAKKMDQSGRTTQAKNFYRKVIQLAPKTKLANISRKRIQFLSQKNI